MRSAPSSGVAGAGVRQRGGDVESQRLVLERATGAWWNAYAAYRRDGGDRLRLWTAGSPIEEEAPAAPSPPQE